MKKIYLDTLTPEEIIKRLKNGETIRIKDNTHVKHKLIDGILCRFVGEEMTSICSELLVGESIAYYFEEQEKFKVEKTGLYKTRNGKTAFVPFIGEEEIYGVVDGFESEFCWYKNGFHLLSKEDDFDLVEYIGK